MLECYVCFAKNIKRNELATTKRNILCPNTSITESGGTEERIWLMAKSCIYPPTASFIEVLKCVYVGVCV